MEARMAVCEACNREMRSAQGGRPRLGAIRHGSESGPMKSFADTARAVGGGRCHDCNAALGEYHHEFCDAEECPRCGGQRLGCDCPSVAPGVPKSVALA